MRRSRIKAHHVSIAVGVAMTLLVIGSYVAASIVDWHDESPVSRPVFGNIPGPLEAVFYSVLPVLILAGAWLFALRVRNWERGQPESRSTTSGNVKRRMADFRAGVYMRTLLRDPASGLQGPPVHGQAVQEGEEGQAHGGRLPPPKLANGSQRYAVWMATA